MNNDSFLSLSVSVRYIVIGIAVFWLMTFLLPNNVVIPVTAGAGLAVLLAGIMKIYEFKQAARNLPVKIVPKVLVSAAVACLSLALWIPLFTFKKWFFWNSLNYGNIILWSVNTGVFCYLLFLETKIRVLTGGGAARLSQNRTEQVETDLSHDAIGEDD